MAHTQVVQARVRGEIKAAAAAVLAQTGLSVSDAIRILLTKIAAEKELPRELLRPNETTVSAMREAEEGNLEIVTLEELKAAIRENH